MRYQSTLIPVITVALLLAMSGCSHLPPSRKTEKPQGEGYGYVTLTYHRDMLHTFSQIRLYYWDPNGREVMIWPAVQQFEQISPNMALFLGNLVTGPSDRHPGMLGKERLFAVQGAAPVVDITDDIVRLAAGSDQEKFLLLSRAPVFGDLSKSSKGICFSLEPWKGTTNDIVLIDLSRDQILTMIREGKANGKQMKDPGTGTPYLKRDWEAELKRP